MFSSPSAAASLPARSLFVGDGGGSSPVPVRAVFGGWCWGVWREVRHRTGLGTVAVSKITGVWGTRLTGSWVSLPAAMGSRGVSASSPWLLVRGDRASFSRLLAHGGGITLDKVTVKSGPLSLGVCRIWPHKAPNTLGWGRCRSMGLERGPQGLFSARAAAASLSHSALKGHEWV